VNILVPMVHNIKSKESNLSGEKYMKKEKQDSSFCPDLNIIEEKGRELNLRETTITKAKDYAREYFKKTDKIPKHPEMLMPAFLYIAAIVNCYVIKDYGERRTQAQIEKIFHVSSSTISKWYVHIANELHIEIIL